jgi:eukaryotic-like serine/threonine-protein kinase
VEPGEVVAGRYAIERLCAGGGMAVVYRARDTGDGSTVALKVLRGHAVGQAFERFKREADVLAALTHPAIVRCLDRGVTPLGEAYLVQDWVEGPTLAHRLRDRPLDARASVAVAIACADALAAAHAAGVVHRDVKPSNIMLAGDDPARAKLVDFGVARLLAGPVRRLTRTGAVVGTVDYMAPEQARGAKDVDARADVFALGAVLYECLAASSPFRGRNALATRAKIIALEPAPLGALAGALPEELVAAVGVLMAKAPADRPADGAAAVAVLRALGEVPATPAPGSGSASGAGSGSGSGSGPGSRETFTCVVMSAPATPLLGRPADELRGEVEAIAASHGCTGAVIDDGSALIMAPLDGTAADRAAASVRAALALKRRWDVVPITVAGGLDGSLAGRSIDDRSVALDSATLHEVFADLGDDTDVAAGAATPGHGVLIEPDVAALVEERFEVVEVSGALRVMRDRR